MSIRSSKNRYIYRSSFIFLLSLFSYIFFPSQVHAHAFGAVYTLPIPFWLYLFGAAGTLVISFLAIGYFAANKSSPEIPEYTVSRYRIIQFLTADKTVVFYKVLSLFLFLLTIITGLLGEDLSAFNFNMPFFWIVFVVGFTYLTFLIGNVWHTINPLKVLVEMYEKYTGHECKGSFSYPNKLGYYPALIFYLVFISLELLYSTTPFSLSIILIQYSFLTGIAVVFFGRETWFTYGEFFSVFFRLIGYCSPVITEKKQIRITLPFASLLKFRLENTSILLFILAMLATTAFDGLRETNIWYSFYWDYADKTFSTLFGASGFHMYEWLGLLLSPFFFYVLYYVAISIVSCISRSKKSIHELTLLFGASLLPIVVAYNIAHYLTLLVLQGPLVFRLLSDPFGWKWDLFGTANFIPNTTLLDASFVWHFQVAVILIGHIVSVVIAHFLASHVFSKGIILLLSQIPMLLLMVVYTIIGLWILSQPIGILN